MESGLWHQIKNNPLALGISIALHVVLLVILSISLTRTSAPRLPDKPKVKTVQAVVVDAREVDAELEKLKKAEQTKKNKEEQRKRRLQKEMKQAQEKRRKEEQRLAKLKKQQQQREKAEKAKQAALEKERKRKQQELAALEEQRRKEQQRLAAIEEKRKAEEEAARKKREAEEAEARRKAEEAELKRRLAEEEQRQRELSSRLQPLRAQYIKMIERKSFNSWTPPSDMKEGWYCEVMVQQNALGDVTSVKMIKCDGSEAFKSSVERAVLKASPLPAPPDPQVFDKKIQFTFKPKV